MQDVIELLLQKKATLDVDREAEKALACEKIDAAYAERSEKIDALLDTAGYVPPVVEEPDEQLDEQLVEQPEAEAEIQTETNPYFN